MLKKKKNATEFLTIEIEGQLSVPVTVVMEKRNGVRAAIGKKAAILRLPQWLTPEEKGERWEWFERWVRKQFSRSAQLRERFKTRHYQSGDQISVGGRHYQLEVSIEDRKTHGFILLGSTILLKLSEHSKPSEQQACIPKLLSRAIGKDFLPAIADRVRFLNNKHFQQEIKGVRLKYNYSNWGSCSSRGVINLSTRLLFAPPDVIDYVIIHELAHLIEFNHSEKFWDLVRKAMPDYNCKEKWLKEHSGACYF